MPTSYKILGQVSTIGRTLTTLYSVPSNTQAIISTITLCNTTTSPIRYRLSVRPNLESLNLKHYIMYDANITANELVTLTIGMALQQLATIEVYSDIDGLSFSCFGSELT